MVDKTRLSGVDADDVLEALGRTREEAIIVVGEYGQTNATAMAMPGADMDLVMTTTGRTWRAISVVRRTETQVAGRRSILLVENGRVYLVAQARGVTYVVGSPTESIATELLSALLSGAPAETP